MMIQGYGKREDSSQAVQGSGPGAAGAGPGGQPPALLALEIEFERNCRAVYDQMARIAVEPQWARFYDFDAGRMPQSLAELTKKSS